MASASSSTIGDMVQCPYNVAHRMLRKKLQSHLTRCRLSYPDVELKQCPFSASHMIPVPEFPHHVKTCPNRALVADFKFSAIPHKTDEEDPRERQGEHECEENWDDVDVAGYDPKLYSSKAPIMRAHVGGIPSGRKEFRKNERKRLGDEYVDEASDNASDVDESIDAWNKACSSSSKTNGKESQPPGFYIDTNPYSRPPPPSSHRRDDRPSHNERKRFRYHDEDGGNNSRSSSYRNVESNGNEYDYDSNVYSRSGNATDYYSNSRYNHRTHYNSRNQDRW